MIQCTRRPVAPPPKTAPPLQTALRLAKGASSLSPLIDEVKRRRGKCNTCGRTRLHKVEFASHGLSWLPAIAAFLAVVIDARLARLS